MTKKPKSTAHQKKSPSKASAARRQSKSQTTSTVPEPHVIQAFADLEAVTGAQSTFTR